MCSERRQRGLTLIELIMFIVIVGAALAGVLSVLNLTTRSSADPMIRKQALAVAEAILEEVMLQPFTWCDPDDPQAATATGNAVGATGCTSAATVEGMGPEAGEARGSFDNVNDYHGLDTAANIADGGAAPFAAAVAVQQNSLNGVAADASLLVTVTVVAGPETIQLQGYRLRHSPNFGP